MNERVDDGAVSGTVPGSRPVQDAAVADTEPVKASPQAPSPESQTFEAQTGIEREQAMAAGNSVTPEQRLVTLTVVAARRTH
ncbi:hypothetical protein [Nonomuraea aridisoli]|uniref:hypothetical protein n=1 Tax=Nonomuraea aridisoli TaxID=2070368 RepID=UPI0011B9351B|nr:hypothetical protein [Nonomuraea aridisoli]